VNDLKYWVGFNIVQGIGPVAVQRLLDYFGGLQAAWEAAPLELARAGLDRRALNNLGVARATLDLDAEMEKVDRLGARVLTWQSPDYPERLRHIDGSPPVLYIRGTLTPEDDWAVAVVGTRRASAYGREMAHQFAAGLARNGVTVVSGLARGIDGQAHQSAVDAGGRTLAVLGSGVDVIYPAEHRRLAERIIEQGALISDYALGVQPEARNFPPRNRLISGLSRATLVVEADMRSGAMITAVYAAEQGREVFAVPGSLLSRNSELPHRLIRDGARLVRNAQDILEELNLTQISEQAEARAALPENAEESLLLKCLADEPRHVDEISRSVNLPIEQVTSALALMELKGLVRQVGGMRYAVLREAGLHYTIE